MSVNTKTVLAVHQGYELYGSDRTFISSLRAIRDSQPGLRIEVLLPREGELSTALRGLGFEVKIEKLWVARKADGAVRLFLNGLKFPFFVERARRRMQAADLTYINTSVVFDYAVAARFCAKPTVLHVHEIPTGLALRLVRAIAQFSRALLLFNSKTTAAAFAVASGQSHTVVLNGVPFTAPAKVREPFDNNEGLVRLLMIGRINSWKGQDLLVRAVAGLPPEIAARVRLKFAGAAFEDGPAAAELRQLVAELKLEDRVKFEGFVADPSALYQWSDVVVVPSKKPEPFGLVAVEAMAHARPVIAARHGGLTEIVRNRKTGLFFAPGDAQSLSQAIADLVTDPERGRLFGDAGRVEYQAHFTEQRYMDEIADAVGVVFRRN